MGLDISVHPRGCGEHCVFIVTRRVPAGSSPRVRGTLSTAAVTFCFGRFIPAGAGNTRLPNAGYPRQPVHPRGCGEHHVARGVAQYGDGSSPRVRGTRAIIQFLMQQARFIPAGAGNTEVLGQRIPEYTVHPRGCGEHNEAARIGFKPAGSSPRVRGTPLARCRRIRHRRFIPAGAGNTR